MSSATSWRDVVYDDETRAIIKGSVELEVTGTVVIRLPHRLESPNKLLHAHWRVRTKDKEAWASRIRMAVANACGVTTVSSYLRPYDALMDRRGYALPIGHRNVTIDRQVPSSRNFIRDRENLVYSVKSLLDQVKYAGFILDDSMKHITLEVTQRVSDDRRDWTVIRIEIQAGANLPLSAVPAARKPSTR